MRAMWQRTILAVALGLGVTAGLVRAGEPIAKPAALSGEEEAMLTRVVSEPLVPAGVDGESEYAVESSPHHAPPKRHRLRPWAGDRHYPLADWWRNRIPLLCYSHFNDYSCGGVHSEYLFHFGSCRQFFGERCLKGPPPSIVPGFDPQAYGLDDGHHHGRHHGQYSCPFCR
jgi:hypothetical protein